MARGRMLNRKVATSLSMHQLPDDTCRLLATWLIPFLDKRGVYYADPAIVRATVFPRRADLSIDRVDFYMQAIESAGMVTIFEAVGQKWQYWPKFADNQIGLRDDRETTDFPPPPAIMPDKPARQSGKNPEGIRKRSREKPAEVKRSEEKLSEVEGEVKSAADDVTRDSPVTHATASPQTHPTQASMTPPPGIANQPAPKKEKADELAKLRGNPAVEIYRETFNRWPNARQMRMIAEIVSDMPRWSAACDDWQAHDWKPTNVPGLIGKYQGDREAISAAGWPRRNGQQGARPGGRQEPAGFEAIREAARRHGISLEGGNGNV